MGIYINLSVIIPLDPCYNSVFSNSDKNYDKYDKTLLQSFFYEICLKDIINNKSIIMTFL